MRVGGVRRRWAMGGLLLRQWGGVGAACGRRGRGRVGRGRGRGRAGNTSGHRGRRRRARGVRLLLLVLRRSRERLQFSQEHWQLLVVGLSRRLGVMCRRLTVQGVRVQTCLGCYNLRMEMTGRNGTGGAAGCLDCHLTASAARVTSCCWTSRGHPGHRMTMRAVAPVATAPVTAPATSRLMPRPEGVASPAAAVMASLG